MAIVLAASFSQDLKGQRARADQATQQVAAAADTKAKTDQLTADLAKATADLDQGKAKIEDLEKQLAAATKDKDQLKAKADTLAAELAAAKKATHP